MKNYGCYKNRSVVPGFSVVEISLMSATHQPFQVKGTKDAVLGWARRRLRSENDLRVATVDRSPYRVLGAVPSGHGWENHGKSPNDRWFSTKEPPLFSSVWDFTASHVWWHHSCYRGGSDPNSKSPNSPGRRIPWESPRMFGPQNALFADLRSDNLITLRVKNEIIW